MTNAPLDSNPTESSPPGAARSGVRRGLLGWGLPITLLAVGGLGFAMLSREPAKPKLPPTSPQALRTKVIELPVRDYPVILKTHGVVRPHNESVLSAQVSGRVARFSESFEDGAFFDQEEVLMELESGDYRNAVAIAEARVLSAKAALQLATLNHQRNADLLKASLLSQTEADRTEAALSQATAEATAAQASFERAQRDLDRTQIRAPFAGCVRQRSVGLGQLVGPGTPLGTVFAVDWAEVRLPVAVREIRFLDLPEERANAVNRASNPASQAPLQPPPPSPAFDDVELLDGADPVAGRSWPARIARTEGALDRDSLDLFLIARVDDPFGRGNGRPPLRPGQPVTALIRGRVLTNVVALPRAAVRELDRVTFVDRRKLALTSRRVTPIWSDEQNIVVAADAVPPDHLVATTHLVYAPEGAKVEIIPEVPTSSTNTPAVTKQLPAKP